MILPWTRLAETVRSSGIAAMVRVHAVRGSAPREAGAWLVVRPDGGFWGTIGGGTLEYEALGEAQRLIEAGRGPALRRDWPLGPDLGQCCGGHVTTLTETFDARDLATLEALATRERDRGGFDVAACLDPEGRVERRWDRAAGGGWTERWGDERHPLLLFGAGHVGRALAIALAPLPMAVTWLDPRAHAFPPAIPANASLRLLAEPADAIASAPPGASVMVMTHSHPLDLAVVGAALARADLGRVGLIGSATKRARFLSRLRDAGLGEAAVGRLVCPVGVPGIGGKDPAIIAASVAAQVLQWRDEASAARRAPVEPSGPLRARSVAPGVKAGRPRRRAAGGR